ncbi:DNA topoisomerase III [Fistulifera solaris]|uniref:DNA topoisomerase n=1 Tax=Fistulifera solaris TaxID=1519565 RepID=A0A1Z5JKM3_FISSO|nr:DNA topoisomerase III [Fistulifera solaris]|eukprot:GAX14392.1 DNA topoisomerase III [Fistulifera solaris]
MTDPPSARGGRGRGGRGGRGRSGGRGRNNTSNNDNGGEAAVELNTVVSQREGNNTPGRGRAGGRDQGRGRVGGRGDGRSGGRGRAGGRDAGRGRGKNLSNAENDTKEPKNNDQPGQENKNQSNKAEDSDKKTKQKKMKSENKGTKPTDVKTQDEAKKPPKKNNKGKQNNLQKTKYNDNPTDTAVAPSIPPSQPQQTSDINYGKGQSISILHVAEKPSIAQAIAHGLCHGSPHTHRSKLPVHEFTGPVFPKAPQAASCKHKVTSVAGHVFSVDFPQQYQSWDSVDPSELFDAPVDKKPCQGSVVRHLKEQSAGVDFIVLWMDCDREGENINFEVLDCCMDLMKKSNTGTNYDRVYRAYFSAINASDIQKAYQALGKPDRNQALSVDARQELDLKVGVAFSRFQTRYFQGRYGDLDSAVLSYGPCQTPTLGFCVQRHLDIETFKPEPYWVLELGIYKRGRQMRALWNSGRSFQKAKVEALKETAVENEAHAVVQNVVTKDKKQGRPTPLNTVALLKACSKALGIGPHSAMQIAERLYLSGYLSYPRTESTAYPKSFDINGTLQQQTSEPAWGAYVRELLQTGVTRPRGGVDMGDHPPITIMRSGLGLSGDMARVYELVARHFIATVSPDAVWRSTRVDFSIAALGDKGHFTLSGKEIVSPGFLAVLKHKEYGEENDDEEEEEEKQIPEFTIGEVVPLATSSASTNSSKVNVALGDVVRGTLSIKEKMTTPPTYLTESELISLMEKNGIGTDASIATHIENVIKRNYVTLETGRKLIPSKLGLVLAQGYHFIDSSLVLPRVRSDIEDQCNKISKGLASREVVVKRALALFKGKYNGFVQNIQKMDVLFASSFSKLEDIGKPFTRCGLTRRYLQYIPGPPERLYNKWTESVYPLPSGGIVKQWSGRTCPINGCNFELCLYSVGQPQRTFPLCPRCYNDPDWALDLDEVIGDPDDREDAEKERQIRRVAGRNLTLECPLPDQHPLVEELRVAEDPDGDGVLILDPHFGPKFEG